MYFISIQEMNLITTHYFFIKMYKKLSIFTLFALFWGNCIAQQSIPINIPTPNATSLGRYGDIKVSLYNGTADINVPIFSLNTRGVKLDIKLEYSSSGVMMNSLPGWIGENWTLSAGGVITRVINGNPDEYIYPKQANISEFHNYFEGHYRPVEYINGNTSTLLCDAHYHKYDTEPDMFYFNFMGKTGKFFLGNDGDWKVVSEDNLDIIFDISNSDNYARPFIPNFPYNGGEDKLQPKTIYGFKIRDTDGTVYTFGYNTSAIDYFTHFESMSDLEYLDSWLASAWYLTKVEDRLSNTLYNFQYERGPFTCQWTHFGESTSWDERGNLASEISGYCSYQNIQDPTRMYSGQLNSPTYLGKIISGSGEKITFYSSENRISMREMYPSLYNESGSAGIFYSSFRDNRCPRYIGKDKAWIYLTGQYSQYLPLNWSQHPLDVLALTRTKQLNSIYIDHQQYDSRLDVSVFRFKYNDDNSRMHLKELGIGHAGATIQRYKFRYNQYDRLPHDYLTQEVDHWGFYNGRRYTLPPALNDSVADIFYSQRNPDSTKVIYGTLQKIIYPTGGACLIEYEPNDFSRCQSLDRQSLRDSIGIGGGVRVKSIAEYEDSACVSLLSKRLYSYLIPGTDTSSGQLFSIPKYYWKEWEARTMGKDATSKLSTFRSSSIIPLSNTFGSALGYSYVTETLADGSKTTHHYSNISDCSNDNLETIQDVNTSVPSPFDKFTERGYARGKLLSLSMFDPDGHKVKSTSMKYRSEDIENNYTYASSISYRKNHKPAAALGIFDIQTQQFIFFPGRTYRIFHRRYSQYEQTDSLFWKDGRKQVTTKEFNWRVSKMNFNYPYQHHAELQLTYEENTVRGSSSAKTAYSYPCSSADTCTANMAMKHFVFTPELVKRYRNDRFVEGVRTRYEWFRGKFVQPRECIKLLPEDSICETYYYGYTQKGNLNGFRDVNGVQNGIVWGNNDNLPVVLFKGNYMGGQSPATNEAVFDPLKNLELHEYFRRTQNVYPMSYSYDRLGNIRTIVENNGRTTYYNYNRLGVWLTEIMDEMKQILTKYEYNVRK